MADSMEIEQSLKNAATGEIQGMCVMRVLCMLITESAMIIDLF